MIATYPVGGVVWDYGQYALGLESLGFEVTYLEDTGGPTYDPVSGRYGDDPSYGVAFLEGELARLSPSLSGRWHFRSMDGRGFGLDASEARDAVGEADVFLNVSGSCLLRPEHRGAGTEILVDTDPGWNHFVNWPRWDRGGGWPGVASWRDHDAFFTYAERIGRDDCALPDLGIDWNPTRPPVVLDRWRSRPPGERWTTVMTWDNFRRPIPGDGVEYGTKEREFWRIEEVPTLVDAAFEIAVGGDSAPRDRWRDLGWGVRDSVAVSETAAAYREYVEASRGEISVAKNVYAETRSGWFSCRSTCYLAAGRPVVLQDTGFAESVPTGEGLLAFESPSEAASALERVESDYERHSAAARAVAAESFAAERVLGEMMERAGVG